MKEKLEASTSPHRPSDITLAKQDVTLMPSVSCDDCGHKTKTENGIKLHKKKKHEVPQIDGNTSFSEEQIQEEDFKSQESEIKHFKCIFCPEDDGYCHCWKCKDCESMMTKL